MTHTQRLLRTAGSRQMLAAFGRNFGLGLLACAGLFFALLLVSRLLGLIPNWFSAVSLAVVPAVALLFALLKLRRPEARETARLIDDRTGGKELFLTAAMIGESPGEFQPIVVAQAEQRAREIKATQVVPFVWQQSAGRALAALAVLAAGVLFLPQLDPFKKDAERKKSAQHEERLQETKKATAIRAERLSEQAGREAERVQQALADLDKTFKNAKPREKEATLQRLAEEQKELGELWRQVNNSDLRKALDKAGQNFGQADAKKLSEWREQLKRGDISALKKELAELREQIKQLAAMPESAEQRAQREAVTQRLNQLAQGMKESGVSPQLSEALSRALEQLDLSKLSQMSKEAAEAAMESLNLSEQELQQLAQAMKDGQALEEALKNLQMAKQLAAQGKLDGEACKNAGGMKDYAALFAEKMAQLGEGQEPGGSGMGPGIGNGARRPEDESAVTGFKSEKSSSALTAGKMLLEWKTKEVGETGKRSDELREGLRQVKQGVSEALQAEQVPPGYHEAIKKYFDSLPENAAAK